MCTISFEIISQTKDQTLVSNGSKKIEMNWILSFKSIPVSTACLE